MDAWRAQVAATIWTSKAATSRVAPGACAHLVKQESSQRDQTCESSLPRSGLQQLYFPTHAPFRIPDQKLNDSSIFNECILRNDDYSVANKVRTALSISFDNPGFIQ